MIRSLLFFGFLLFISLSQRVAAQQTYAVVVGVSDYKRGLPGKGDLEYSDDDARLFSNLLKSHAGGDVPSENIRLLIDRKASRANILDAMSIFQKATSNDRIIFFFSGHGGEGMFLPYDAAPEKVLWHTDIKAAFRESIAGTKMLMADACMAGSMRTQVFGHALHPPDSSGVSGSSRNSRHITSNVVVMLSSRQEDPGKLEENKGASVENKLLKQGAFTYYLIKGVRGAADSNKDGTVTIKELHFYISLNVQSVTGQMTTGKGQTPQVFGNFPENLSFTSVNP